MTHSISVATFVLLLVTAAASAQDVPDTRVLVVPDPNHPWAAAQLGAAIKGDVTYFEGTLLQALSQAKAGDASGVLEIKLATDVPWETGRVVCYAPNGRKLWEEKVFVNFGAGAEAVARKFADKLEKKVNGKMCSAPRNP